MRPGCSSVTPDELAELRKIPGNEGVRLPEEPKPRDGSQRTRVCVRLRTCDVPLVEGETLAVFVRTHDREMAEQVADAVLHARGLEGQVIA